MIILIYRRQRISRRYFCHHFVRKSSFLVFPSVFSFFPGWPRNLENWNSRPPLWPKKSRNCEHVLSGPENSKMIYRPPRGVPVSTGAPWTRFRQILGSGGTVPRSKKFRIRLTVPRSKKFRIEVQYPRSKT